MRFVDLLHQVTARLPWKNGGTGNQYGWGTAVVIPMTNWSTTATLAVGTIVQTAGYQMVKPVTAADSEGVFGVVVGYYRESDRQFVAADCPVTSQAAVMVRGVCKALAAVDIVDGDYAYSHATDGYGYGQTIQTTGAFGRWLVDGDVSDIALIPIFVGMIGGRGRSVPLTTKGDLFGYDTTDARVPVGANGQVLTANSVDAQGIDWQTPFLPTGIAAKGDIVVGTANDTPAVLTVGTDGKVLSARASATEGIAWEDEKGELLVMFTSPGASSLSKPMRVPANCTLTGWYLVGNASGSIVLDIWKDTLANYPPVVGDTIIGGGGTKPTLSAARTNSDTTLTGYTTSWTEGDWILVNVDSVSGLTEVVLALAVKRR